jgi:RPA family protein
MVELSENNDTSRFIREPAKVLPLSYIKAAQYQKQEGWNPNYIEVNNEKVFRVNVIGIVVSKEQISPDNYVLSVDDGFSTMPLRTFDRPEIFLKASIGDFVIVVGKPREFSGERYILTEILRKIENNDWINYRRRLFEKKGFGNFIPSVNTKEKAVEKTEAEDLAIVKKNSDELSEDKKSFNKSEEPELIVTEEIVSEETIENNEVLEKKSPGEIIYSLIKDLDNGEGADIDAIIKRSNLKDAEKIIDRFIKEGEIYQSKPGKVKIL